MNTHWADELCGDWRGHYSGHFEQTIRIYRKGDILIAEKVTGDDYVPAGEITWQARISTFDGKNAIGQGQISEGEFQNPHFVSGRLTLLDPDRISFCWEQAGEVEFRKDF